MSSLKTSLKSAKDCLSRGEYREALQHCKAALKADKTSYEAYLLIGKAAFLLGEYGQAALAYSKATDLDGSLLPAWKGLLELHTHTGDHQSLATALEHLLPLSKASGEQKKQQDYRRRLWEAYINLDRPQDAESVLQQVLDDFECPADLPLLCQIADIQGKLPSAKEDSKRSTEVVLQRIVTNLPPSAAFAGYHKEWLELQLRNLPPFAEGSGDWVTARKDLLLQCLEIIHVGNRGPDASLPRAGCCTWAYFEGVLSLSEQLGRNAEAFASGNLIEAVSQRLKHQFPWRPKSRASMALALGRRYATASRQPCRASARRRILKELEVNLLEAAKMSSAWLLAAEYQLLNGDPVSAKETSYLGQRWLEKRTEAHYPPVPEVRGMLRLTAAEADLMTQHTDKAEAAFRAMAEETKGKKGLEWADKQRLLSLKGLAATALAKDELQKAQTLLKHLLADPSTLPEPVAGEVQVMLGWTLHLSGNPREATDMLEAGLLKLQSCGGSAADTIIGEAHLKLGSAFWAQGGAYRTDRNFAHKQWLAAAALEGPSQGAAFAWLGCFYWEVAADSTRAQKCFQRALLLDPMQSLAGLSICRMLQSDGRADAALLLCQEITSKTPEALWAWKRLGRLLQQKGQHQEAVLALQTGLRGDAKDAQAWETLGFAYQSLGRLTAAIKSYAQATAQHPGRSFSWIQSATIHLSLGAVQEALEHFGRALAVQPNSLPALLGSVEALLCSSRQYVHRGMLGQAGRDLASAEVLAARACSLRSNLRAAWKLQGDVFFAYHAVTPSYPKGGEKSLDDSEAAAHALIAGWDGRLQKLHLAKLAYSKALHLGPHQASHWADLAAARFQTAQTQQRHISPKLSQVRDGRGSAERLIKGGLRLHPASAALWAALGSAAVSPGVKEYAFSRALQLDPKMVAAWVGLGRLYIDHGGTALAGSCFEHARSHDPTAAVVWEGMGALAGLSPTGESERMDYYEHAVKLGANQEALLGFAEGALKHGRGAQAAVLVAACRVAAADPLNPAAHSAKGAVLECRRDYVGAARSFKQALSLLHATATGGKDGSSELEGGGDGGAKGGGLHGRAGPVIGSSLQSVCHLEVAGSDSLDLQAAMQLNLGRTLARGGNHKEALKVLGQLEESKRLDHHPMELLAYAEAIGAAGNSAACENILSAALQAKPDPQIYTAVVARLCDLWLERGDVPAAMQQLQQLLTNVVDRGVTQPMVEALLRRVLVGIAKRGGSQEALAYMRQLHHRYEALTKEPRDTGFVAMQMAVEAKAARLRGDQQQSHRLSTSALHMCPWSFVLRADVEARVGLNRETAEAAARPPFPCPRLHSASQHSIADSHELETAESIRKLLRARACSCLTALPAISSALISKEVLQWLHEEPQQCDSWLFSGLVMLRAALSQQSPAAINRASTLLKAAQRRRGQTSGKAERLHVLAECYVQLALLTSETTAIREAQAAVDAVGEEGWVGPKTAATSTRMARFLLAKGAFKESHTQIGQVLDTGSSREKAEAASLYAQAALLLPGKASAGEEGALESAAQTLQGLITELQLLGEAEEWLPGLGALRAQLLLRQGDLKEARWAAESALEACTTASDTNQSKSKAVKLLLGHIKLSEAAEKGSDVSVPAQAEARELLAPLQSSGTPEIARVARLLLSKSLEGSF